MIDREKRLEELMKKRRSIQKWSVASYLFSAVVYGTAIVAFDDWGLMAIPMYLAIGVSMALVGHTIKQMWECK
ncbi:hypothetical protein [Bacillus phage vB_BceS-M2]